MKVNILSIFLLSFCLQAHSASFDCAKAKSKLEKFICSNPAIDDADKKMGEAFREARKQITLKGYISADQKYWLKDEYSSCGAKPDKPLDKSVDSCLEILNKRISDLNSMKGAGIYTNYDGDYTDGQDSVTIQILGNTGSLRLKYQGNTFTTPEHISYCWGELAVAEKGAKFYEKGEREALFIKDKDSLELLQQIYACNGPAGGIPPGKFKLRQ